MISGLGPVIRQLSHTELAGHWIKCHWILLFLNFKDLVFHPKALYNIVVWVGMLPCECLLAVILSVYEKYSISV